MLYKLQEGDTHRTSWGLDVRLRGGTLHATLPVLRAVGIRDLCQVERHDRVCVAGVTSHTVRFRDGGTAHFAYNHRGELIEFSGHRISASVDQDGRVLLSAYMPEAAC